VRAFVLRVCCSGKFMDPACVSVDWEVDGAGNVFVSDWGNHSMVVLSAVGEVVLTFGWQGIGAGELKHPRGV
jgi:hypothetical protein